MIIKIDTSVFGNYNNFANLTYLLNIFAENRRYEYYCEYGLIKDTDLFNNLLRLNRDLIEEYFNRFIRESSLKIKHTISDVTSENSIDLVEAKILFNQPFILILENNLNDGFFIDQIITVFRKKGKVIRKHKKNNWLRFGNAGGAANIRNFIEGEKKNYNHLPKENYKYLKCFVLVDSDKKHPTDFKPERDALYKYLAENNIPFHELTKREIENYMPSDIIESIISDEYIKAFQSLTPIQKDYFDIENGLQDKNMDNQSPEIQELYKSVSKEDISILRKSKMNLDHFKTEFPKFFEHASKEQLKKRTSHQSNPNELEVILDTITKLL